MDVSLFRPFAMLTIFLVAWIGGSLVFVAKRPWDVSHMNMFTGGIFLAGGYLHLLPDSMENESLNRWSLSSNEIRFTYPWAFLFCCCGFLAVLIVEEAAKYWQHNFGGLSLLDALVEEGSPLLRDGKGHHGHSHGFHRGADTGSSLLSPTGKSKQDMDCMGSSQCVRTSAHDDQHAQDAARTANLLVAFILTMALTFHSLMEGLGLGASSTANWGVYFAIIAHKGLAAFSLSSRFAIAGLDKARTSFLILFFGCMTPVGIALGWLAAGDQHLHTSAASGVCLALSAGTFIYIATIEIIPKELANPDDKLQKILYLLAGFTLFAVLAYWC